jgi:hypothetical protein
LPCVLTESIIEHTFDSGQDLCEWPPPPTIAPPEEVIDCLVESWTGGVVEPVRWSEFVPDGLLADLLAAPPQIDPGQREFETLERIGAWERVVAWAQARQAREMTWFMESATVRNRVLGACDSPGPRLGGSRGRFDADHLGAHRGVPGR